MKENGAKTEKKSGKLGRMSTKIETLPFCSENTASRPHKLGSPTISCKTQTKPVIRQGPEGGPSTFHLIITATHIHRTPPGAQVVFHYTQRGSQRLLGGS